jgi:predicted ester cyclase
MAEQDNIRKVEAGVTAVNARDMDGFVRLLEPGFKLHLLVKPEQLMPQGQKSQPEAFREYLEMLYEAFPDFKVEQTGIRGSGNMVHQELFIHGTHTGTLNLPNGTRIPPTRLRIRIPCEVFHTFNAAGGFIASTGYVSLLDLAKQFRF